MLDFTQPRSKCTLQNYVPKQIKQEEIVIFPLLEFYLTRVYLLHGLTKT